MVLEGLLERLLLNFVAPYVDGISRDRLRLGIFRGCVQLEGLQIKAEALALLAGTTGLRVQSGSVGLVKVSMPLQRLLSGRVSVEVRALRLEVEQIGDRASAPVTDADLVREMRDSKQKAIQVRVDQLTDLVAQEQASRGGSSSARPGWGARLARRIVQNINIDVQDMSASYSSNFDEGFACGVELEGFSVASTDADFGQVSPQQEAATSDSSLYKLLQLRRLGFRMAEVGCRTLDGAAYVVSPVSGSLRLSHVPRRGVLEMQFDIAHAEVLEMRLKRSLVKHLRAVQSAGSQESARLHHLLIDPREEETLLQDVEDTMDEYGALYERQLEADLVTRQQRRMQLLEDALSVRLLARRRLLVHEKLLVRELEEERRRRAAEERPAGCLGWCARRAAPPGWCHGPCESWRQRRRQRREQRAATAVRGAGGPAAGAGEARQAARHAFLENLRKSRVELTDQNLEQLLTGLGDSSKYEEVDMPQKWELKFQIGIFQLNLIDDRWGQDEPSQQCLSLSAEKANMTVSLDFATDYHGRDSAQWKMEVRLGEFHFSHEGCSVFEFLHAQELRDAHAARLVIASELGQDQNLMRVQFSFAPTRIHMAQGLVEEVRDFWRAPAIGPSSASASRVDLRRLSTEQLAVDGSPQAESTPRPRGLTEIARGLTDLVLERSDMSISAALDDRQEPGAFDAISDMLCERLPPSMANRQQAANLAEKVAERIPDKLVVDVKIDCPIFHIPIPGQGETVMNLGGFHLRTPQPCDYCSIDLRCSLANMAWHATTLRKERFDMFKPVEIDVGVQYRYDDEGSKVMLEIEADHVSMMLAPQALQMLMATPFAAMGIICEKERSTAAVDAIRKAEVKSRCASRLSNGSADTLPLDGDLQGSNTLQLEDQDFDEPAPETEEAFGEEEVRLEKPRQFLFTLCLNWKALDVTLADSVVPVLVLHMQWPRPGLEVYKYSLPHSFLEMHMRFTLEVEILNPRNNAWEPLVEHFHGYFQMVRELTSHGSDKRIMLSGRDELLLNLKPSTLQRVSWFMPLFLKGFTFERDLVVTAADGDTSDVSKYRVVSLCSEELELEFKSCHCANLVTRVGPTGSEWRSLDREVTENFATALVVRQPGGRSSEPLSLEHDGVVVVPDIGVVAELLTPSPLDRVQHRMLLLSPPLRIHNQTDLPLVVRFHAHDAVRPELLAVPSAPPCDAALLGRFPPEHLEQSLNLGVGSQELAEGDGAWPREEGTLELPPNFLGAVPLPALVREAGTDWLASNVWLSSRPAGFNFAWSSVVQAGATADPSTMCCRGMASGPQSVHLTCETRKHAVSVPSPLTLTTVVLQPPLRLVNALPTGDLIVGYGPKTGDRPATSCWEEARVPRLRRLNLYNFPGNLLADGLTIRARLESDDGGPSLGPWTPPLHFGAGSLEERGGASKTMLLRQKSDGAEAGVVVEHIAGSEVRFSSPFWFADRSGLEAPLRVGLRAKEKPLPQSGRVTLLPADCLEESSSCELQISGGKVPQDCCSLFMRRCDAHVDLATGAPTHAFRIPPSWSILTMGTPFGAFVFCVQVDDVATSDVLGARCQLVTLRPRLVLHNSSGLGLEIDPMGMYGQPLELAAGKSIDLHWNVRAGEEEKPETAVRFRPLHQGLNWSDDVLCSDDAAGSTPFLLMPEQSPYSRPRQQPQHQVWTVEVAPVRGSLTVSFRQGSEFVAQNCVSRAKMNFLIQPINANGESVPISVPMGAQVPYGWTTPFKGERHRSVFVTINGKRGRLNDVRRTQRKELLALKCVLTVSRMGSQTLLTLEDHESAHAGRPNKSASTMQVEIKLARLGVSLIEEAPQPRELFFIHLDLLRLQWENTYDRDLQQLKLLISDMQVDCQLDSRTGAAAAADDGDGDHGEMPPDGPPAVIMVNRGAGEGMFLRLLIERNATSSRDLCLPRAEVAFDSLDITVDDGWLEPLVQWVTQCQSGGTGPAVPYQVIQETAGVAMTKNFAPPELPSVVNVEALQISTIALTLWSSIKLKTLSFLPAYLRTALKVLSFSDQLTLDAATLSLPSRSVPPHRGSLNDFVRGLANEYTLNLVQNTGRVLGKSSLLNLPRVPLNLGGNAVCYAFDTVGMVVGEAALLLNQLAFDDEYVARQRLARREKRKQIHGFREGMAEAGKSLGQGIEGMADVFRKPAEGWRTDGLKGAVFGCGRGVAGGIVKPVANIVHSVADVGDGISAQVNPLSVKSRRHMARRRFRQPRLLFTEGAAVRPWRELDAELLRQLGGRMMWGIQEIVPLAPEGQYQNVLLLYSYRLVLAQVEMPTEGRGMADPGGQGIGLLEQLGESTTKLAMQALKPLKPLIRNVQSLERKMHTAAEEGGPADGPGPDAAAELAFADLASIRCVALPDGDLLQLARSTDTVDLPLRRAPITPAVLDGLVAGFRSAVAHPDSAANWAKLRAAQREELRSSKRLENEAGEEAAEIEAHLLEKDAGEKVLEFFEVERWRVTSRCWETPFLPMDKGLSFRWVDAAGKKHPLCQKMLSWEQISSSAEPPCEMDQDPIFRPKAGWEVHIKAGVTDGEGWRYGVAWKASTWDPAPGIFDVLRKRKWLRAYA